MANSDKAPPKTFPQKIALKKSKNADLDLEIYVEVARDAVRPGLSGGKTTFEPVGSIPQGRGKAAFYTTPEFRWELRRGRKIVTDVVSPLMITGTVRIQTFYGPRSHPTDRSAYGRGTTRDDKNAGNTTLGFHEACHREDYLRYLRETPLPRFSGRPGMTVQQFQQSADSFARDFKRYFENMEVYSRARTDEVGDKKSRHTRTAPVP